MNTTRTILEGFLFWWLVASCTLLIAVLALSAILPPSIASVSVQGPTLLAVLMTIIVIVGLLYFTWLMRNPSPRILLIGMLLFFWSAIRIIWADGLMGLTLGLPLRLTLVDNPSLTVQLDLIAIIISALFAFARHKRVIGQLSAQMDNQNDIVVE